MRSSPTARRRIGVVIGVLALAATVAGTTPSAQIASALAQQSLDGSSWSNLDLKAASYGPGVDPDDPVLAGAFPLTAVRPAGSESAESRAWRHVARLESPA